MDDMNLSRRHCQPKSGIRNNPSTTFMVRILISEWIIIATIIITTTIITKWSSPWIAYRIISVGNSIRNVNQAWMKHESRGASLRSFGFPEAGKPTKTRLNTRQFFWIHTPSLLEMLQEAPQQTWRRFVPSWFCEVLSEFRSPKWLRFVGVFNN